MRERQRPDSASPEAQESADAVIEPAPLFYPVRDSDPRPPVLSAAQQRYERAAAARARCGQPSTPIQPRADVRRRETKTARAVLDNPAAYGPPVSSQEALLIVSTVLREFYQEAMKTQEEQGGRVVRRTASARKNFAVPVALMIDKLQVLAGRPSEILEHRFEEASPALHALARRLLALEKGS